MTVENFRENNPNKYRLSDGTIITESNYNTLLQAFTSTYNSMTDENTGYVTDVEKRNLNALLHSFEVIGSRNLAMEFDKESRFLAYTHWNSQENKFDVNHRNPPEKWFEKTSQQLQEEQEKEEIETAIALDSVTNNLGTSYEEWEEMLDDNQIAEERIEQSNKEIYEKNTAYTNLMEWANQTTFDEADGLDGSQIFEKYDNEPIPIAVLPKETLIAFDNVTDRNIYSGKAYFIDHMVNHHNELDVSEYENFQEDLDNYDKIYNDPKNGSIVFEKNKNNKKYSVAVKELEGNLVFYKSYHYGDKTKKRFVEIDLEQLRKDKSVEVGKSPISHSEYSESGRPLSALTDNLSIVPFPKMSSEQLTTLQIELTKKNKEIDIWTSKAEADNKEISRLNDQLEAANNTIQKLEKQNKEQDELLNGKGSVKVNGVERKFEHGLKQAFPEAVKRIDIENQHNKELTADYNELLKSQNQNIAPVSPTDYDTRSD